MSDVVYPEELVCLVQSIRPFQLRDVGNDKWLDSHETIIKLSQQAILEAKTHREESVKEFLIQYDKLKVLIHEAFCISLWKTKVLPHLSDINPNPQASFLIYTVFFHEGSVISLLETALFHQNGCESLKEASLDLIDYCAQAIAKLIGLVNMGYHENETDIDVDEGITTEMERQERDMLYKISLRCISILNYLVDNLDALPGSAARRLVITHDVPWLLADLLNFRPWYRKSSKGAQKYIDDVWTTVAGEDLAKVVKHEAQTWFCLRQILFNPSMMESYEMNDSRQKRLGQCQGLLHDTLLDQLPPLIELKQYLCTLSIGSNNQPTKKKLILEELPEIKNNLIKEAKRDGGYLAIANSQTEIFLTTSREKIHSLTQRLSSAYNTEFYADMETDKSTTSKKMSDSKRCPVCKNQAEKKCSKCKQIFYCSRQCQLKDWPSHKKKCITEETETAVSAD